MKNKILLVLCLVWMSRNSLKAQNNPQFTNFTTNKLAYNPAYSGSEELLVLTAIYRHQWQGIDGAPRTALINGHTPLFGNRVGLGGYVQSDQIGMLNTFSARLAYAYRIALNKTSNLSFGMQLQYAQVRLDWTKAEIFDAGDTDLPIGEANRGGFNVGIGAYYQTPNVYVGLSTTSLLKGAFYSDDVFGLSDYKSYRPLYLMAGTLVYLSNKVVLKPAVLLTHIPNAPFEANFNVNFIFNEFLWVGGSYHLDSAAAAILQIQVNKQLRIGGAYDFTLNELKDSNIGSFEVALKYLFNFENGKLDNMRFF